MSDEPIRPAIDNLLPTNTDIAVKYSPNIRIEYQRKATP